jgi:hypothetical protein
MPLSRVLRQERLAGGRGAVQTSRVQSWRACWVNPKLDPLGNARAEIAALAGSTVIDVHEFTAMTPDVAVARALMLKQYDSLKSAA